MTLEKTRKYELEYVCECDHTGLMHSMADGCTLCDCIRNRQDVVIIGRLTRENNDLKRQLKRMSGILESIRKELIDNL